jgi:hypothetical protein
MGKRKSTTGDQRRGVAVACADLPAAEALAAELQARGLQARIRQIGGGDLAAGMQHKILIDCRDEAHQAELLDRFEADGIACKALIV